MPLLLELGKCQRRGFFLLFPYISTPSRVRGSSQGWRDLCAVLGSVMTAGEAACSLLPCLWQHGQPSPKDSERVCMQALSKIPESGCQPAFQPRLDGVQGTQHLAGSGPAYLLPPPQLHLSNNLLFCFAERTSWITLLQMKGFSHGVR